MPAGEGPRRAALARLPDFPLVLDAASNRTIFADAAFANGTGRWPSTSNAGYGISHLAAIYPAQRVTLSSAAPLLEHDAARSDAERI